MWNLEADVLKGTRRLGRWDDQQTPPEEDMILKCAGLTNRWLQMNLGVEDP
jgi:hypothetical protein